MSSLPPRRTTDFVEEEARVTRCGTFTVRAILYSAPSRLIGHRLKVRLYSDRLDCYLSGALVLTLARGTRSPINGRGRVIDYRHFIDALKLASGLAFSDPAVADAYSALGFCLLDQGNEPYARRFLQKALEAGPTERTRLNVETQLRALERKSGPSR